jgi:hypothetical protein
MQFTKGPHLQRDHFKKRKLSIFQFVIDLSVSPPVSNTKIRRIVINWVFFSLSAAEPSQELLFPTLTRIKPVKNLYSTR